ncbi:MAG: metallopeptidase TldD-related protein [bacterium]
MKTQKNYVAIANVLEECVAYAKSLKVRMENPQGIKEYFQISDISLTFLNYETRGLSLSNGISGTIVETSDPSQLLVQIWITNAHKTVGKLFAYPGLLPDPTYLKMHFNSVIQSNIRDAVNAFFTTQTKDNKYSLVSEDAVVSDINELPPFEEFTSDGITQIKKLFRWLYIKSNISLVKGDLSMERKIWIVCNGSGTKIIQHQDHCSLVVMFDYLSSKKNIIEDIFVDHYKTFKEVVAALPDMKTKIMKKLSKMEQKRIEGGVYPVLLKSTAVATLFHEAIAGHMLSGSYIVDGVSTVFENKLNKKIGKKTEMPGLFDVSVYDQPLDVDKIAHYKYDMEGVSAKDICLLDKGIVKNYLTDRNSAIRLKQKSNGHNLAQSFVAATSNGKLLLTIPEPRVSNLFVQSHTDITLAEISASVFESFDFYLEVESRAGEVFVDTGVFDLLADHITRVWKDGRRESVAPGTFSGSLTDFLASIQMVSNHYGESKGFCGSGSGMVPTHEVAPAMLLYGINFVTEPKPEKELHMDLKKDKYVPKEWLEELEIE